MHGSQYSNKGCVLIIIFYFTYFKELLSHRQRKILVRGHTKDAYISGHTYIHTKSSEFYTSNLMLQVLLFKAVSLLRAL